MKKRLFTRIIAVVSVFAALLLVLTGCGNSKKSSSQSNNPSSVQQIKKTGPLELRFSVTYLLTAGSTKTASALVTT